MNATRTGQDFLVVEKICGIIGHPLGHSLSPLLHNAMFQHLGLPYAYTAWPTPPDRLAAVVAGVRALPVHGLSVTIPHKEEVMALCDEVTERARAIGAVNTLYWRDGRLVGENTDVTGFCAPLRGLPGAAAELSPALVLGAGGVARAAVAGLRELGAGRIILANRSPERGRALAREMSCEVVAWEERGDVGPTLVVNATALGMSGERVDQSPWPAEAFRPGMIAYDLVYNPVRTRFVREAEEAGCRAVDGLTMFLEQAAEQFRLWTGCEMDMALGRSLLAEALSAPHGAS
ncbi:Shikimate dehydrogenase [Desulfovibrio sp. X2]|uniref:shikimate dehydrogenase n=1 Tax=Desulfovibrio sp. X2 TaxID=941449 RepID=UPI000358BBAE|nr:shikimate dehydrogenase [Desulfovibrio sp. X2]EPR44022.1 Shikimate dehydrogenase [Desulfovibrio sp. X2]